MCLKTRFWHTMVSGYSIWHTLMPLISSGDRRPNWISLIVRRGALECSNINVMIAVVLFFYLDVAEPARNWREIISDPVCLRPPETFLVTNPPSTLCREQLLKRRRP